MTWALVRLLLRVIVTVPLPATIEPVTLVVLQPTPVHTEIGSALAVAWAKLRIPNTAKASIGFLRLEKLGISSPWGHMFFVSRPQLWKQIYLVKAWDRERSGASARSNIPAR